MLTELARPFSRTNSIDSLVITCAKHEYEVILRSSAYLLEVDNYALYAGFIDWIIGFVEYGSKPIPLIVVNYIHRNELLNRITKNSLRVIVISENPGHEFAIVYDSVCSGNIHSIDNSISRVQPQTFPNSWVDKEVYRIPLLSIIKYMNDA